jgi:hypothetical protein
MIIWGTSTKVGQKAAINVKCSHCDANAMSLTMYHKVFTLFYFPMFAYNKAYSLICDKCNTHYNVEAYDIDVKALNMKYSRWNYIGLWVLATLMVCGQISSLEDKENIAKYKQQPRVEDLIVFKTKETSITPYGYFKIIEVTDDKIIVKFSKYSYKSLLQKDFLFA